MVNPQEADAQRDQHHTQRNDYVNDGLDHTQTAFLVGGAENARVSGGFAVVPVGDPDVEGHVQGFLRRPAQGIEVAVGGGFLGELPAGDAAHPQAGARPEGLVAVHEGVVVAVVGDHRTVEPPFAPEYIG